MDANLTRKFRNLLKTFELGEEASKLIKKIDKEDYNGKMTEGDFVYLILKANEKKE